MGLTFRGSLVLKLCSAVLLSLVLGATINVEITSAQTFLFSFGTRGSGDGQFIHPFGIAVDVSGDIYVVDTGNRRIQKFDPDGNFIFKFGTPGTRDGRFFEPRGITLDGSGNIYVADAFNDRVQKFDSSGNFVFMWGWGVRDGSEEFQICTENCRPGLDGSGDGQFNVPSGVAVDGSGDIYVADTGNRRIQKFDPDGNFIFKFGTLAGLAVPVGVAVDVSGDIYVADTGNDRIQKFDPDGNFIFKFGTPGSEDGEFKQPVGVAVDVSGDIYVADTGNDRIQKFDPDGNFIFKFGTLGSEDGQFRGPRGITLDGAGNIYVADASNDRIQVFLQAAPGRLPGNGGGCSIAAAGTTPSIPLYLLLPVLVLVRRMWVSIRT